MPNGGGTESRVRATLYGAFALGHELSGGKRLPAGGEVFDIHLPLNGSDDQVPRIAFRVVSTAFEGLVGSERFSLVHEALLAGASNGPLHGAYVQPTGRSEGEFDVIPPSGTLGVHHKVLIEARTHSEIGQSEPSRELGHARAKYRSRGRQDHCVQKNGEVNQQIEPLRKQARRHSPTTDESPSNK